MIEKEKERDDLEKVKAIMQRFDPPLLSAALKQIMIEADEAEEADVAKVKEDIKRIYDSIPEGKDRISILSKAVTEVDSDIIEKEVKVIKENLAGIDKETIMKAARDLEPVGPVHACGLPLHVCLGRCLRYKLICDHHCIRYFILIEYPEKWEIGPLIEEQLMEEIIQEVVQRPELSRAMRKMLKKIKDEK